MYLKRSYQFVWVHKPQNVSRYVDVWFVLNFRSTILTTVLHIAFSNAFQGKKSVILLFKFHRIMFHGVQLTCLYWFRLWPGAEQATGNRMNQRWSNSLAHICISRPEWAGRVSLCWWHDRCTTAASRASSQYTDHLGIPMFKITRSYLKYGHLYTAKTSLFWDAPQVEIKKDVFN